MEKVVKEEIFNVQKGKREYYISSLVTDRGKSYIQVFKLTTLYLEGQETKIFDNEKVKKVKYEEAPIFIRKALKAI
jgi:hypothetical protein